LYLWHIDCWGMTHPLENDENGGCLERTGDAVTWHAASDKTSNYYP